MSIAIAVLCRCSPGGGGAGPGGSRRRRRRLISGDDADPRAMLNGAASASMAAASAAEQARCDAMMEGTRMLVDNLREKVAALEDRCEKMDREKVIY